MKFIIEHLSKQFGPKEVLRDIDFTFEAGRIYGLLGRNGAGKTTLFNCLNRDLKADGGSFWLEEGGPVSYTHLAITDRVIMSDWPKGSTSSSESGRELAMSLSRRISRLPSGFWRG